MSEQKKIPAPPKRRLSALDVVLIGVGAAVYAVLLTTTSFIVLFPGIESLRWANFFPAFLGLFFGPFVGGLGAGFGNVIGDLAGGLLTAGSWGGMTGNYIAAYVVAKYGGSIERKDTWKWAVVGILAYTFMVWSWIGNWVNVVGIVPMPLWHTLNLTVFWWASYAPVVLVAVFANIFRNRILKANLFWRNRLQVKKTGPWPVVALVVGSILFTIAETANPVAFQGTLLGASNGVFMVVIWVWLIYDSLKMEGRI